LVASVRPEIVNVMDVGGTVTVGNLRFLRRTTRWSSRYSSTIPCVLVSSSVSL
jgi:hypothetical protein